MATIKSFTSLEQSSKLMEILPLESADMFYFNDIPHIGFKKEDKDWWEETKNEYLPCWSIATLLSVLPDEITDNGDVYRNMFFHLKGKYIIQYPRLTTLWSSLLSVEADNPVDACYSMIIKLHELKML